MDDTRPQTAPLQADELRNMDRFWRACNYLSAGMIYLRANPLLREPLTPEHIKRRLLGHWGSDPGQSFVLVHLNRVIKQRDLNVIFLSGPGHGAPATLAHSYLEGRYSEIYPDRGETEEGMGRLFKLFSFPGGIGSHCTPETPGSIHEGGELGYSLSHGYGAAFDNPDLIVTVMIGDGEAETGPLATSWHSNKFLNPARDGAVLPVLHLNGYKIANPTILARIPHEELEALLTGYGYKPWFVEGDEPEKMHQQMAVTLDECIDEIRAIQQRARQEGNTQRPRWPMIVLRSPKGWTGPREFGGHKIEGTWRAHQVPVADPASNGKSLKLVEEWLRSYEPEKLFDEAGRLVAELRALAPEGPRRISANPHANGGALCKALDLPDFTEYAVDVGKPATSYVSPTDVLGQFLRDVMRRNMTSFRVFGPDETASNKLTAIYEASQKTWLAQIVESDSDGGDLSADGRVMEMLSEHTLEGWLEGYTLTGRHGLFATYEAFVHVIDSMFNQHAKWLEKAKRELRWRQPVPSLNLLITSLVWRQDHNGFTHQDPGFLDVVTNKSPDVVRIYLPPDANCLLSVADHCLRSRDYVNVIVADKQPHLQYLDMKSAITHCTKGIGIWDWASTDLDHEPDVVMASAGDIPTMEALAAVEILKGLFPDLKIRFVNVVDLFRLMPDSDHPHGLSGRDFDSLFTTDKPVIFNFHSYASLVHKLTYRRTNHANIHVHGYAEKGNINTPLELAIINGIDRFSLAIDVIDRVPRLRGVGDHAKERLRDQKIQHLDYAHTEGIDSEEIREWKWAG
ncbi:UNVERIFIED_ORG: xylulose-5-phosphate/fructose-6-phosphate phosphoketolase [Burkholderia sp. CF145]|uniref:phosphoketolase family protein n=1 Tax=Paraburkholderia hospita TaxID=169430 RepID=UPI00027194DA|nr:phosphoketolase family protein [Paraburkholderia hospita]EUC19212.1 phosphoketolase [Burkholderia sp. BT03]SKC67946.1 Phosphoketolase [Paraburkholderia hospita]